MSGKGRSGWKAAGAGGGLIVRGSAQVRKATARDGTKSKASRFLSVLAETCNVTRACEQAGVSVSAVYRRRRVDAAFRAGWVEAIGSAYQRLDLVLIERALNGTEKIVTKAVLAALRGQA